MHNERGRPTRAQVPIYRSPDGRVVQGRTVGLRERGQQRRQATLINTALLLLAITAIGVVVWRFEAVHQGTIYPNVRVGAITVSDLRPTDAEARLRPLANTVTNRQIVLAGAGRTWQTTPGQLGLRLNLRQRVDEAFSLGHEPDLVSGLLTQADLLLNGRTLPLVARYDRAQLHAYALRLAQEIGRPVASAALVLDPKAALVRLEQPATTGLKLDVGQVEDLLSAALTDVAAERITLPVQTLPPDITTESAQGEADRLNALLTASYRLQGAGHTWPLAGPALAGLFHLGTAIQNGQTVYAHNLDSDALSAYVTSLAKAINVAPREAAVSLSNDAVVLVAGRNGRWLNSAVAQTQLADALTSGSSRTLTLPVMVTRPRVSPEAARAEARRLTTLLGARVTLQAPPAGKSWTLSRHQIAGMLSLTALDTQAGASYQDTVNQPAVLTYVGQLAKDVARPVIPPHVVLEGTTVRVTPTRLGVELDRAAAQNTVAGAVMSGGRRTILLPTRAIGSPISDATALAVAEEARRRLNRPTVFASGAYHWSVSPQALAPLLTVRETGTPLGGGLLLDVDQNALGQALTAQAPLLERPARDARLVVEGTSVRVQPAQSGTRLDIAALAQAILQKAGSGQTIEAPTIILAPRVTTAQVRAMGIETMIGSYQASFPGSASARLTNIHAAVQHLDGTLIAPGQIFSFDKQIGDISTREGYVQGIIIQGEKDVPGIGGGICQVADTIFKGALYSGLPLVHWMNHQTLVPYYQPPGMDATVYVAPGSNADVQFQNDTGHWLLFHFEEDLANARLTVRFFGKDLGTQTTVTPPVMIYHPDGSADGSFHRTVRRAGKLLYDRDFHTHYAKPAV